jgi:hypothetical protein
MSESITHTAVVDDALALVVHYDEFRPDFRESVQRFRDLARLGGITRSGDRHNPVLLERLRERAAAGAFGEGDSRKLAFVMGWLSHRACDRQFKRLFRQLEPESAVSPRDSSVYHDVHLFRVMYDGGRSAPFTPWSLQPGLLGHPAAPFVAVDAVEDLFKAIWRRMLVEMHTFIPDEDHVETWLDSVCDVHQALYVDLHRYAEAYLRPDPDKLRRFVVEPRFHDPADPVVALASALRRREPLVAAPTLDALIATARTACQYGQAVLRALRYLRAANAFFDRRLDANALRGALDIGKPELAELAPHGLPTPEVCSQWGREVLRPMRVRLVRAASGTPRDVVFARRTSEKRCRPPVGERALTKVPL